MIEKYYLNTDILPTIPVPHDCVIKKITFDSNYLVLEFEDDISYHDSIKHIKPNVSSLVIRIHLNNPIFDAYEYRLTRMLSGEGYYMINNNKLKNLCKKKLEYLYHNLGFQSIIIKLFCGSYYLLDIESDFIEFNWIEK